MKPTPFDIALEFVLAREGGYVDDPADPGGATYAGVSLRAVVGLRDENGKLEFDLDADGDVDAADIKRLEALHRAGDDVKLSAFYKRRYWAVAGCDQLPHPMSMALFDAAVNHGPKAAVTMLQRAVGAKPDGAMGPETARKAMVDPLRALHGMLLERTSLYYKLATERGMAKFFRGWMARLFALQFESLAKRSS